VAAIASPVGKHFPAPNQRQKGVGKFVVITGCICQRPGVDLLEPIPLRSDIILTELMELTGAPGAITSV